MQECATSIRNSLDGMLEDGTPRLQQIHERLGQFVGNHHLNGLYVLEVHIERPLGDPGLAYDIVDRHGLDRLSRIQQTCRAEDLLAGPGAFCPSNFGALGWIDLCHDGALPTSLFLFYIDIIVKLTK